jgi:hypothetical protein
MENLEWWTSEPIDPPWGPDLAFIRLPIAGPFIDQIKGKKSFWPLTKNPSQHLERGRSNNVFAAVSGFVGEETRDGEPESGFPQVKRLQGYAFIGGPSARRVVNSWDFIDVDGYRATCPTMPSSFGGVSGGGLWTFGIDRCDVARKLEILGGLTLAGVAFYQLEHTTEKPTLRCHGPHSVYVHGLDKIQNWLRR